MSLLDPQSLGTDTPRTLDGRTYPEHLRSYEVFDEQILPLLDGQEPLTFNDLSMKIVDPKAVALLPRWIASATWRGLVERSDNPAKGPRAYVLGPQAHLHLPHAA